MLRRLRAVQEHNASSRIERVLRIEHLEALLFLNGAPVQISYDTWRESSFSIHGLDDVALDGTLANPDSQSATTFDSRTTQLIGSVNVNQQYGYRGTGYTVAVIDTGIDYRHPNLAAHYAGGWDFVDNDADPMDEEGHGTHVAGIIASDSSSYLGVAPDVKIVALRVLDENGSGSFGDVESALQWVARYRDQYNIVSVNLSLGAGNYTSNPWGYLEDEFSTLRSKGVFLSVAAGNSYYSYGSQQGLGFPAISNQVVAVGAVWSGNFGAVSWASGAKDTSTAADRMTSFSQRSSGLDLVAPGAMITSTALGGGFVSMAGTSMAAPVVAGVAALVHQALDAKGLAANQDSILSILRSTGKMIVDGDDEQDNVRNSGLSFPRVNVLAAIQSIVGQGVPSNPGGGQVPTGTTPSATNTAFVRAIYQELLGRPADSAGLSTWSQALQNGMSRSQVVQQFWQSTEHVQLEIREAYNSFLNRAPNANELQSLTRTLSTDQNRDSLLRQILLSGEYTDRFSKTVDYVHAVYQNVLGRGTDQATRGYWDRAFNQGLRRVDFVNAILTSEERFSHAVNVQFQDFLSRQARPDEMQTWTSSLHQGRANLENLGVACLSGNEYLQRAMGTAAPSTILPQAMEVARLSLASQSLDRSQVDQAMSNWTPMSDPWLDHHAESLSQLQRHHESQSPINMDDHIRVFATDGLLHEHVTSPRLRDDLETNDPSETEPETDHLDAAIIHLQWRMRRGN